MIIDTEKIEEEILAAVKSVRSPLTPWLSSATLLGTIKGVQVQIYVTKDEDQFIDVDEAGMLAITE